MEKLGQLRGAGRRRRARWDLIVVDTPPTRSALDFLDAPERLGSFLDGRLIRILLGAGEGRRPGLPAGRRPGCRRGHRRPHEDARRADPQGRPDVRRRARHDVRRFPRARRRDVRAAPGAGHRLRRRRRPGARTRCARRRTSSSGSPRSGCRWPGWSLNRVHRSAAGSCPRTARWRPRRTSRSPAATALAAGLLRLHADLLVAACREQRAGGAVHARVPAGAGRRGRGAGQDVHDLEGLRAIGADLAKASRWRRRRRSPRAVSRPSQLGGGVGSASDLQDALVLGARGLEQPPPGDHVRPAAQQGAALTLGHPAPDAELDAVVERVGQALGAHRAAHADGLGPVLGSALDEQGVRVRGAARATGRPVVGVLM